MIPLPRGARSTVLRAVACSAWLTAAGPGWGCAAPPRSGAGLDAPAARARGAEAPGRGNILFSPLWTVEADPAAAGFDLLLDWVADRAGRNYLLEYPSGRVQVLSPRGERLRALERHTLGARPASGAIALALLPDSTLGLLLPSPAELIKIDRRGNPIGRASLSAAPGIPGATTTVRRAACAGGVLVLGGVDTRTDEARGQVRTHFVRRYGAGGEILATYAARETAIDMSRRRFSESEAIAPFTLSFAVGPDGRVFVAPDRDAYRIEVYTPEGDLDRVIEREIKPTARGTADSARVVALFEDWLRDAPAGIRYDLEPTAPVVAGMQVDSRGRLWVRRSGIPGEGAGGGDVGPRTEPHAATAAGGGNAGPGPATGAGPGAATGAGPGEARAVYDLFDPDGRFRETIAPATPEGSPVEGDLVFLGGDRAASLARSAALLWLRLGGRPEGAVPGERIDPRAPLRRGACLRIEEARAR